MITLEDEISTNNKEFSCKQDSYFSQRKEAMLNKESSKLNSSFAERNGVINEDNSKQKMRKDMKDISTLQASTSNKRKIPYICGTSEC